MSTPFRTSTKEIKNDFMPRAVLISVEKGSKKAFNLTFVLAFGATPQNLKGNRSKTHLLQYEDIRESGKYAGNKG